jgi:hypothetical protein
MVKHGNEEEYMVGYDQNFKFGKRNSGFGA